MVLFRNCDRRWPFLWESADQPAARWNGAGEGPVQYFADTSDGAWAEFLRHEGITEEVDLGGVSRALWAVELEEPELPRPELGDQVMTGGLDSYDACQAESRRLRDEGRRGLRAISAALPQGGASGVRVELGFRDGPARDGEVVVLFGRWPRAVGWQVVDDGRPPADLLHKVRHF